MSNNNSLPAWGLFLGLPLLLKAAGPSLGLDPTMTTFFALTLAAVIGWISGVLSETLIAILLPCAYVVTGVGTGKQVFGGWGSYIPWLVIGGMLLSIILQKTGLARRIALKAIMLSGCSFTRVLAGIMISGYIIGAMIPTVMAKAALFTVIGIGLCETMKLKKGSKEASAVILTCFLAVACPKLAYLTGGGDVVIAMKMAAGDGTMISWVDFWKQNVIPALIYGALSWLTAIVILRPKFSGDMRQFLEEEYTALGPLSRDEIKAMVIFAVMFLLFFTEKYHHVPAGYALLFVASCAFLPGVTLLEEEDVSKIKFGVIFFFMGCMAIGGAARACGVAQWCSQMVEPLLQGSQNSTSLVIYLVGVIANFIITPPAAVSTLTAPLTQIAADTGMSRNVAAYTLLYGADQLIFSYEYAVLLYFYSSGYLFSRHIIMVMGARMVLALGFLFAVALPFWRFIGA